MNTPLCRVVLLLAPALLLTATVACKRSPTHAEAPSAAASAAAAASNRLTPGAAVAAASPVTAAVAPAAEPALRNFALPRRATGNSAAVATAHPLATRAATKAIFDGGTAVDALVAASFMLTVVTPHSTGIGGGGLAVVWPGKEAPATAWDFRETAPKDGELKDYLDEGGRAVASRSRHHGLAVGVPGYVAGLEAMHRRYGKRPWADLVQPAAVAAERGFAIGTGLAWAIEAVWKQFGPAERQVLSQAGKPLRAGDVLRQPALAATLRAIAEKGSAGFYGGAVGAEIVALVRARGGKLTPLDLTTYTVREVAPLSGPFLGHRALTMPQPSAGGAQLLAMAEFTESFLSRRPAVTPSPDNPAALHALAEAMRRSFLLRFAYSGDTDEPSEKLADVYPKRDRNRLARSFDPKRASKSAAMIIGGSTSSQREGSNTSHVAIVDRAGMAVSATHTINLLFGAAMVAPSSGVWLNNELDDFSFTLSDSNAFGLAGNKASLFRPGARPTSSMSPSIVLTMSGEPRLLIGAPGGTRIPTAVFLTAFWHLAGGLELQAASDQFRIHHQALADELWLEEGPAADAQVTALKALGHQVSRRPPWCNVQAIAIHPAGGAKARFEAVCDRRGDGGAMTL